jgi:hypothetical protein
MFVVLCVDCVYRVERVAWPSPRFALGIDPRGGMLYELVRFVKHE